MWPQPFYISPSGAKVELVCSLKGFVQVSSLVTTIPTPNCAQEGDFQVITLNFNSNATTINWNGVGPNDGDWLCVHGPRYDGLTDSYSGGLPTTAIGIFMRRIKAGHTPFAPSVVSGSLSFKYHTYILRGLDSTYYPLEAFVISGYSGGLGPVPAIPGNLEAGTNNQPSRLVAGSNKDIVINHEHIQFSTSEAPIMPPVGGNVLYSDYIAYNGSAPFLPSSIVQRLPPVWVDLMAGTSWADWSLFNFTDQANTAATDRVIHTAAAGNNRYMIYRSGIPLTAGVTYKWSVFLERYSAATGTGSLCPFLSVVDPLGTEHGAGSNGSSVHGTRGTLVPLENLEFASTSNSANGIWSILFTPTLSGNYEFRLTACRQDRLESGDLDTNPQFSGTSGFDLGAFSLVEDTTNRHGAKAPVFRRDVNHWQAAPRKLLGRRATALLYSNNDCSSLWAVLAATPDRPVVDIGADWAGQTLLGRMNPNRLTIDSTPVRFLDIGANEFYTWYTPVCVYPQIADAFYFEIEITSAATGGRWGVFYGGPTHDANSVDSNFTTDWFNHFWYTLDGTAWHGPTSVAGLAPLTTGDVLGVAVRFDTLQVEFYVNGTRQHAFAMDTSPLSKYTVWRAFGDLYMNGSVSTYYTLNFTGPWAYPVVAGAAPFDWANTDLVYHGSVKQYSYIMTTSGVPLTLEYPPGTTSGDLVVLTIWQQPSGASTVTVNVDRSDTVTLLQPSTAFGSGTLGVVQSTAYAAYAWFAGDEKSTTVTASTTGTRSYQLINYRNVNPSVPFGWIRPGGAGANIENLEVHFPSQLAGAPINPAPSKGFILSDWPTATPARNHRIAITVENDVGSVFLDIQNNVLVRHHGPAARAFATVYSGDANLGVLETPGTNRTLTNLLDQTDGGFGSAAWTRLNTGVTVNDSSALGAVLRTEFGPNTGVGQYQAFTQQVTLEAGKRYTFLAEVGGNYYPALFVDDGTNGPRGYIWPNNGGTGQVATGGWGYATMPATWNSYNTRAVITGSTTNKSMGMGFTAQVSGVHTFYVARGHSTYTFTNTGTTNTSTGSFIDRVALVEGFAFRNVFSQFADFAGAAGPYTANVGDAVVYSQPANITNSHRVNTIELELIAEATTPADTRWVLPNQQNALYNLDATGLETVGPTFLGSTSGADSTIMASTGVPPPAFAGPDQFQFEVEILALSLTEFSVGVMVHQPAISALDTTDAFDMEHPHMWAYRSLGTATADGGTAITGLDTTTTVGNIVTVAVHRSAGTVTFYKNGVQLVQLTGVNNYKYPLMAAMVVGGTGTNSTTVNRFRANFKGPFSYPVTGFSPYQWW